MDRVGDIFERPAEGSGLARFCLARLRRFARLAQAAEACGVPEWERLARHATLAAYRDCRALGLDQPAATILRH